MTDLSWGRVLPSEPIKLGEDFELDVEACTLRRDGRALKLERIPMDILMLLVEKRGRLVSRDEIVERIWGKGVFLDTDNSINGAVRKIRQVLKDDPEKPRFLETVTGRGYRFIAMPVESAAEPSAGEPSQGIPVQPQSIQESPSRARRWPILVGLAVLLAGVAGAWFFRSSLPARSRAGSGRVMLAVLPFENLTGDPSQEYFTDGMTEEMITGLGNLNPRGLGVIARTSVMFYKRNPKPLDEVGRELGVQYVLEGSVRRDADKVRVTAQLIRVQDQTHVWARQYDRELKDVLVVQSEIVEEVAEQIRLTLGGSKQLNPARRSAPPSYEAYDLYLRGLYSWNKRTAEGLLRAADYFQEAIDKDPKYARGYAGLANSYGLMSTYYLGDPNVLMPKARAAASRALEIDEMCVEAYAALGLIAESYDYNWRDAEIAFRRAIELDPSYATAHQWYAEHLAWRGRFDEALAESERARQLDPLSLIIASDHGQILFFERQYDRAIAEFRTVLAMDPNFGQPTGGLFAAYVESGRFTEALEFWRERTADPWRLGRLVYLYKRWGRPAEAQGALAKVEQFGINPSYVTPPMIIAYAGGGKNDQALSLLQKDFERHSSFLTLLKVDPIFDPLRDDPRFQDLLRRVGLAD